MTDEDPTIPPPISPDVRIFASARDGHNNALISTEDEDWYAYAEGYKRAADQLVQHIIDGNHVQDFLVYPIGFMYRHYLELRFKEILRRGPYLVDDPAVVPSNHNLPELWARARKLLRAIWKPEEATDEGREEAERYYLAIDSIVKQFDEVDQGSFSFRYPVTKAGKPSLPGIQVINVRHLAATIASIAMFLDGSVLGIDELRDQKHEYEADMADDSGYHDGEDYGPGDY